VGIELDSVVEVRNGPIEQALDGVYTPAVAEIVAVIGFEPDRLVIIRNGSIELVLGRVSITAVAEILGFVGLEPNRLVVGNLSPGVFGLLQHNLP
jgi:hypothetical protein